MRKYRSDFVEQRYDVCEVDPPVAVQVRRMESAHLPISMSYVPAETDTSKIESAAGVHAGNNN